MSQACGNSSKLAKRKVKEFVTAPEKRCINRKHVPLTTVKNCPICSGSLLNEAIIKTSDKEGEGELHLKCYESMIADRDQIASKLAKKTGRRPVDLIMNIGDEVRKEKEIKAVLEHAQLEPKPSFRGDCVHPPVRLPACCPCQPVYELFQKPEERGEAPRIEHIGVPDYILATEKGHKGKPKRKPRSFNTFSNLEYRTKRELELDDKIKKIEPHRPEVKDLVIRGTGVKVPSPRRPVPPCIDVTPAKDEIETKSDIYALRINDTVIFYNDSCPEFSVALFESMKKEKWHEEVTQWKYYFNVPLSKIGRGIFYLENLGTVSIIYRWTKLRKPSSCVPRELTEEVFFFNKNEEVIYPGQRQEIKFTFISEAEGTFEENWQLLFSNVDFTKNVDNDHKENFVISLIGDCYIDIPAKIHKMNSLETIIETNIKRTIVTAIISGLIDTINIIEPIFAPYKTMFEETDMFIVKNPIYFKHQTEVDKLNKMYIETTAMVKARLAVLENDNNDSLESIAGAKYDSWDFNMSSLHQTIIKLDYENRMEFYDKLKLSHRVMLQPLGEGDDLNKKKYTIVYSLLCQFADRFNSIYSKLKQGSATVNIDEDDFFCVIKKELSDCTEWIAGALGSLNLYKWTKFEEI